MNNDVVPLEFIRSEGVELRLSWAEILWAYRKSILSWRDLIQIAVDRLAYGSDDPDEIEIASCNKENIWRAVELVEKLAHQTQSSEEMLRSIWLFLLLAWVYSNRVLYPDPLRKIEQIYADFNYPKEIESFVRYMPPTDGYIPGAHTPYENEKRIITNWEKYLEDVRGKRR